ncbi:MAG: hypothetical protein EPN40_14245 [Rhodanobacteraceae bacterium]|nr:MAG: hypothetical protein EPN40_14245 [Rhodanobacteraceae bacterium]
MEVSGSVATTDPRFLATFDALVAQLGGRAVVRPGEALAAVLGERLDPEGAAKLRLARGTYPFPTVPVGGLRRVLVADIAATLCGLPPPSPPQPVMPTPARGRAGRRRITAAKAEGGAP